MKRSTLVSILLHASAVVLLVIVTRVQPTSVPLRVTPLVGRDISRYLPTLRAEHGGGGGGARDPLPASKGKLPRFATHVFTPPVQVILRTDPLLAMEPTLLGNPQIEVPKIDLPNYGDPNAARGPL